MLRLRNLLPCLALLATGAAYTTPNTPPATKTKTIQNAWNQAPSFVATAAATAALSLMLVTSEPALAAGTATSGSKLAAQITLNSIPPTSVEVNIRDLPLVGEILSGTYTKVSEPIKNPSVTISSPKDKIGAIKAAATNGHLEFDVNGVLSTHLDIDAVAEEAGIAKIRIASPLIPQLPFKNPAANPPALASSKTGGKVSEWFVVTNMGSGESYYYNDKTGDTQFQKPGGF